ncbi:hypothetical protein, unlikely [Trypanosoma brucei gambiense DAL972]|uniref:Uncharacterized protein n=1 Tax=Trypanosoma brucei gambiense (strain MHOM/CI/86/DAL972) TaxID=679716 RepID=C9ZJ92_TRYB9|nr:hypothetical protein, unlikely [Trypanosoma brucei gambiense DAL972]CBH09451.1 hypothetical protein, unlikely [Trypanosoma brucei gambiense DAL972]|eukprot:XP_011771756.1 hypothetical protein, unlikely [Trypanosoma brucei gambiense DAL972]
MNVTGVPGNHHDLFFSISLSLSLFCLLPFYLSFCVCVRTLFYSSDFLFKKPFRCDLCSGVTLAKTSIDGTCNGLRECGRNANIRKQHKYMNAGKMHIERQPAAELQTNYRRQRIHKTSQHLNISAI